MLVIDYENSSQAKAMLRATNFSLFQICNFTLFFVVLGGQKQVWDVQQHSFLQLAKYCAFFERNFDLHIEEVRAVAAWNDN